MKRVIILALIGSAAVMAASGNMMPSFDSFDSDGNGKVTQTEFENAQQERMKQQAEAGKMMRNAGNAPTFAEIDSNGDGVMSQQEFQSHQTTHRRGGGRGGMGQGMSR